MPGAATAGCADGSTARTAMQAAGRRATEPVCAVAAYGLDTVPEGLLCVSLAAAITCAV
jgi:hypothetical protein